MDAIGGYHDIGFDLKIAEHRNRQLRGTANPLELLPKMQVIRSEAVDEGVVKDLLKPATMRRELRARVSSHHPPRLSPDLLTQIGAVDEQFGCDRPGAELVEQPERSQFAYCVGK